MVRENRIADDFDRAIRELVDVWTEEVDDAEIADVLERWLDDRCASDWF